MDPTTLLIPDPNTCPPLGKNPSMREFRAGLGDYALGLYALSGIVTAILAILVRGKVFFYTYLHIKSTLVSHT